MFFGGGRDARAVGADAAMRAGADAGIFLIAPVNEIVPRLRARFRVIGNFVGRHAARVAKFLRDVPQCARSILVGRDQLARAMQHFECRAGLDRQLIERKMLRREGERLCRALRAMPAGD